MRAINRIATSRRVQQITKSHRKRLSRFTMDLDLNITPNGVLIKKLLQAGIPQNTQNATISEGRVSQSRSDTAQDPRNAAVSGDRVQQQDSKPTQNPQVDDLDKEALFELQIAKIDEFWQTAQRFLRDPDDPPLENGGNDVATNFARMEATNRVDEQKEPQKAVIGDLEGKAPTAAGAHRAEVEFEGL